VAFLSISLLLTACSESPNTPSSQVLATGVTATPTARSALSDGRLATAASSPTPEPSPPPAAAPTQEPLAPPSEAPSLPAEPAPSAPEPVEIPSPLPPPPPTVVAGENASFANRVVELINAARRQEGLEPLSVTVSLTNAAQSRARTMAEAGVLSHTAPDGSTVAGRVQAAGYGGWTDLGEVIAAGPASPEEVVECWLASPDHRADLLDPNFKELGVGYYYLSSNTYKHWWVADLAAH
jgi:uncharacterized protein YkwD